MSRHGQAHQPPHHAVAHWCATPCRRPSAASATPASLSSAASQRGRDFLGAEASGRDALHGETLLCGSHHVVRRLENTCDLREMWLVMYGYVIKPVMCVSVRCGKMCGFVINFTTEVILDLKGLEICCFHPNFEPPPMLYDNLKAQ